jgi:hypothetical protein
VSTLPALTLDALKIAAGGFARLLGATPIPELFGVTDGKAVGTYVEAAFHVDLARSFDHAPGSAAKGIDLPALGVDLKVTSLRQPQSSCPFRDATQKVYGLGYHLLVFVYDKSDDSAIGAARLDFQHVLFIDRCVTADYQTTRGLRTILDNDGNVDDVDAFLEERNLPLEAIGRRQLAERIVEQPPDLGCLTISNALQWRLQYGRALQMSAQKTQNGLTNLLA